MTYPLSYISSLYLIADSASENMDDVVVSVTGYPNCYPSSSGYGSSSWVHSGHSNVPCSDGDCVTAWQFKVTGPDTKVVGQLIAMKSEFLAPLLLQTLAQSKAKYEWTISGSQPIAGYATSTKSPK